MSNRELLKIHTKLLLDRFSKKYKFYKRLNWIFGVLFWIIKIIEFVIFITSIGIVAENGEIIKFPIPWSLLIKLWTFDSLCMYMIMIYTQETEDLLKLVEYYGYKYFGRWYWSINRDDYM